jgi:hypothetical protein
VDGKFDVDASASEKEHDNGEQNPVVFRICGQGSSGSTALVDEDWHGVGPREGHGFQCGASGTADGRQDRAAAAADRRRV